MTWSWTEEAIQAAIDAAIGAFADKSVDIDQQLDAVEARFLPKLQAELAALKTPALAGLCQQLTAELDAVEAAKRARSAEMPVGDRIKRMIAQSESDPAAAEAEAEAGRRRQAQEWYTTWVFDQVVKLLEQRRLN